MNVMGYVWGRELAQTRPERLLQRVLLTHSGLSVVLGDSGAVCDPCPVSPGTLEPHWSGLLWTAMLISLAIVIALPKPHGIRALIASTILRLIFSVGLQPTLFLLGAFNVSRNIFIATVVFPCKKESLPFGSLESWLVWVLCYKGRRKGEWQGTWPQPAQGTGNLLMSYLDTDELIFREVRQEEGKQVRLRLVFPIRSKGCWDRRF